MPVKLVFIHGWGFNARFWDLLAARLADFPQARVDLEFFGDSQFPMPHGKGKKILIGHSLGFIHGINQCQDWSGWIAINGFTRSVATKARPGCVPVATLREMRARLQKNPGETLRDFYKMIGATAPAGNPDADRLRDGLDELRDADVTATLEKLDVPGLALAGSEDPLVPLAASETLGRLAKHGGLVVNEGGDHLLPQKRPAWTALVILDFIHKHFGENK